MYCLRGRGVCGVEAAIFGKVSRSSFRIAHLVPAYFRQAEHGFARSEDDFRQNTDNV